MIFKSKLLIFTIFVLAFSVRFVLLTKFPPVINRDEAAIGYNAYSLLKTGRDEWGQYLPLAFRSFGDYKMPAYIYATILPVAVFGLGVFAVRFWSAAAGGLAVILIFFLANWFFPRLRVVNKKVRILSAVAAVVLALNPWHVYFSRMGFEANLSLTLFLGGVVTFVYGLKRRWLLPLGALCFVATLYTYSSSFLFLPLFLTVLVFIFFREIWRKDWWLIIALILFLVGAAHATLSVWQVTAAKANITVFNDPGVLDKFSQLRTETFRESPLWARLWLNKPFFFSRIVLKNYLASFSPNFLFFAANRHPWHQIQGMGDFYWLESVLVVLGLVFLVAKRNKISIFLLLWLLLSPLPSAITVDAPHATRMLQIIPPMILLITLGWWQIWLWLKRGSRAWRWGLIFLLSVFYFLQVCRFGYLYFSVFPKAIPAPLLPGIEEVISWLGQQKDQRLIIFGHPTDSHVDVLYAYLAFYTKYEPQRFQKEAIWRPPDLSNLTEVESLGNYRFWLGVPDVKEKAFYVLPRQANPPGGFSLRYKVVKNRETLWSIYSN